MKMDLLARFPCKHRCLGAPLSRSSRVTEVVHLFVSPLTSSHRAAQPCFVL